MGFFDRFKKKGEAKQEEKQPSSDSGQQQQTGRRIKKYTSDGKPVYE